MKLMGVVRGGWPEDRPYIGYTCEEWFGRSPVVHDELVAASVLHKPVPDNTTPPEFGHLRSDLGCRGILGTSSASPFGILISDRGMSKLPMHTSQCMDAFLFRPRGPSNAMILCNEARHRTASCYGSLPLRTSNSEDLPVCLTALPFLLNLPKPSPPSLPNTS